MNWGRYGLLADHLRDDAALSETVDDLNRILSRLMTVEGLLAADERGRETFARFRRSVSWLEGSDRRPASDAFCDRQIPIRWGIRLFR